MEYAQSLPPLPTDTDALEEVQRVATEMVKVFELLEEKLTELGLFSLENNLRRVCMGQEELIIAVPM